MTRGRKNNEKTDAIVDQTGVLLQLAGSGCHSEELLAAGIALGLAHVNEEDFAPLSSSWQKFNLDAVIRQTRIESKYMITFVREGVGGTRATQNPINPK